MGRSLDILSSFRRKERVPSEAEVASPMELSTIGAQHGTYNNPEASPDSFNDRVEQVTQINSDVNRSMNRSASRRSSRTSDASLPGPILKQSPSLLRRTTSLVKQPVLQKTLSNAAHFLSLPVVETSASSSASAVSPVRCRTAHYLSLVVAENPVEAHREWRRKQTESEDAELPGGDLESGRLHGGRRRTSEIGRRHTSEVGEYPGRRTSDLELHMLEEGDEEYREEEELTPEQLRRAEVCERWQAAARSLMSSVHMVKHAEMLADRFAHPADRFYAVVELERALSDNPHKALLIEALERKRSNNFDNFFERLISELFITGEKMFDLFTPTAMHNHLVPFTCLWTLAMFVLLFYMIGEFPMFFQLFNTLNKTGELEAWQKCYFPPPTGNGNATYYAAPQLIHWITSKGAPWCYTNAAWTLNGDYLIQWGGRWGPFMKSQPHRWFTSFFIHQSFQHVLSNMLLFVLLCYQIEEKYGWWRAVFIFVWSAVGGNFFSACFESHCTVVVGASGGIFGLLGLFIADMVLNFETLKRPIMRCVLMVAFLVYFIVTVATTPTGTSNLSHVGGFICGLFPGFLFLPNLKSERWEAILPWLGIVVAIGVYVGLPSYFYTKIMPNIGNCGNTNQY